jgi:hypothetical protein
MLLGEIITDLTYHIDERPYRIRYKELVAGKKPSLIRCANTIVNPSLCPAR